MLNRKSYININLDSSKRKQYVSYKNTLLLLRTSPAVYPKAVYLVCYCYLNGNNIDNLVCTT